MLSPDPVGVAEPGGSQGHQVMSPNPNPANGAMAPGELETRIQEAFAQELARGSLDAEGLEARIEEALQQEAARGNADQTPVTPLGAAPPTSAFMSPAPDVGVVNETGSTMESSLEPDYTFPAENVNVEMSVEGDQGDLQGDLAARSLEQEPGSGQLAVQGQGVLRPNGQGEEPVPAWRSRFGEFMRGTTRLLDGLGLTPGPSPGAMVAQTPRGLPLQRIRGYSEELLDQPMENQGYGVGELLRPLLPRPRPVLQQAGEEQLPLIDPSTLARMHRMEENAPHLYG